MLLCYQCFLKLCLKNPFLDSEMWDKIPCDSSIAKECKECKLNGIYIREVK